MADVYPAITDVRAGVTYGPDGAPVDGTLDLPAVINVRAGTAFDRTTKTGTLDLPDTDDVKDGVIFDRTTKEGTCVWPDEADVRLHTEYGVDGEYVGTLQADPNPDPSLTLVQFDKHYPPWNLGEVCGFTGEALVKLLAAGIVKPYTP